MCWLDRRPHDSEDRERNQREDAIDEEVENELDCLQGITTELLRELSRLKIEASDRQ